jgi:hypothetical protein
LAPKLAMRILAAVGVAVSVAACQSALEPPPPPPGKPYVAEFYAVSELLADREHIQLGAPITADEPTTGLLHFQRFQDSGSSVINSAEMHYDGCIYVSYTPPRGPLWYASNRQPVPNEADQPPDFATGIVPKDRQIPAGRSGTQSFTALKAANVDVTTWVPPESAFRDGRGPAPQWFKICVPRTGPPTSWPTKVTEQIPAKTYPALLNAGEYAFWNAYKPDGTLHIIRERFAGLPDWATVLPVDEYTVGGQVYRKNNGQKKLFPGLPIGAPGPDGTTNYYLTWNNIVQLAQDAPERLPDILRSYGHPSTSDLESRIPWVPSSVSGVVTNSFLSGEDYSGDHAKPPGREST